jgi:WD40 repeat protein
MNRKIMSKSKKSQLTRAIRIVFVAAFTTIEAPQANETLPAQIHVHKDFDLTTTGTAVAVAWSADSSSVAAASNYGDTINIWNRDGKDINKFTRNDGGPAVSGSISFAHGTSELIFAPPLDTPDSVALSIWNTSSGKVVGNILGPQPNANYAFNRTPYFQVSPDGKYLVGGAYLGNNVIITDADSWRSITSLRVADGAYSLSIFHSGQFALIGGGNGHAVSIKISTGQIEKSFSVYEESKYGSVNVSAIAGSPDGAHFLAGAGLILMKGEYSHSLEQSDWANSIPSVKIINANDGGTITSSFIPHAPIRQAVWDPRGRYVALVDSAGKLFIWNTLNITEDPIQIQLDRPSMSIAVNADGSQLAVANGSKVSIFSLE